MVSSFALYLMSEVRESVFSFALLRSAALSLLVAAAT
jgi:hypothetical protein